ncbi:cadherin-like domain-containing protein [Methyloterricola oryzae]|uniref:cadherin-like domain-containing protein n=1 Tax=Methyloterricola oryzae TaxID=1495050 RepID=UPI0005EB0C9F|nr:cadherin-like domain-containing protein [Methyloterricola oryzae]
MLSGIHLKFGAKAARAVYVAIFLLASFLTPAWAVTTTASDTFPALAYTGTDGTAPWAGAWQEFGESLTAPIYSTGQVRVVANSTTANITNCVATNCLRMGGNDVEIQNHGVLRQIDLSGATSATLRFTYRRVRPPSTLTTGLGAVRVEVSKDGGEKWTILARYPFTTTTDSSRTAAGPNGQGFDITSWASVNTRIRFIGEATDNRPLDSVGFFYADDVKVDLVKPDAPPPSPSAGSNVSDSFPAIAYNGSDGSVSWASTPWIEAGETTSPTAGNLRVVANTTTGGVTNCVATNCLRIGGDINNRSASRPVNLGANYLVTANLSFEYRRVVNTTGTGGVWVQAWNGTTWTNLGTMIAFSGTTDLSRISANFDLKPYAVAGTQIRFLGQGTINGFLYIDNVKVAWTINNPPTAADDGPYTTSQNTPLTVTAPGLLGNDRDPESGALTAVAVTQPVHGSLTLNSNGSFTYTPSNNYNGPDSFTYQANDGLNNSSPATVNLIVTAVNQPPAFSPTSYNFNVNQSAGTGTTVGTVSATDPENGAITYAITGDSSGGAFAVASPTLIVANTALLKPGTYTVTVSATDPNGLAAQPPATVTITVINPPPVFNPTSYSFTVKQTSGNGAAVGSVLATDPDGGVVTYAITAGNTSNSAFAINSSSGAITVVAPLTAGTVNLTVSATDPSGAHSEVQVAITVTEVTVNLKVLVIGISPASTDPLNKDGPQWPTSVTNPDGVLGYMQRFLEQAGVPYDVLDASNPSDPIRSLLTPGGLTVTASQGRYNGIILTDAGVVNPSTRSSYLSSAEWAALHSYERDFKVRETVVSNLYYSWYSWQQCLPNSTTCDYDYGMDPAGSVTGDPTPALAYWSRSVLGADDTAPPPALDRKLFSYLKKGKSSEASNPLPITGFGFTANPRTGGAVTVTKLLTTTADETGPALISLLTYPDGREVLFSTLNHAWFFMYSEVLVRDFVNFATQGLFIGESKPYLNLHVDDLFLGDNLWDPVANWTSAEAFQRLTSAEVPNVVAAQNAFRTAHPLAQEVKLEFAFNGVGIGPTGLPSGASAACTNLITAAFGSATPDPADLTDSVGAIQLSQSNFGFINHTYTHLDLDFSGHALAGNGHVVGNLGTGTNTNADYEDEITCNRLVWQNLALPGYAENLNTLLTGEHSGIKDDGFHNLVTGLYYFANSYGESNWVFEANAPFPEPSLNVLLDDATKAFPYAGNPEFFRTVTTLTQPVRYLAGDASQVNQGVEQFVNNVPSNRYLGATPTENFNLVLLPRYPSSIFYNAWYPGALVDCSTQAANPTLRTDPNCRDGSLVDEWANLFRERPLAEFLAQIPAPPTSDYCTPDGQFDYAHLNDPDPKIAAQYSKYLGDLCATRDYATILAADADITVRHMLSWQKYPHYFHEINLKNYDGTGSTLLFDWANAVMTVYESYVTLPVKNLPYWKVGQLTEERLNGRAANISGVWNVTTNTVQLQARTPPASGSAKAIVTGVTSGGVSGAQEEVYGGQTIATIPLGTTTVTVPVVK